MKKTLAFILAAVLAVSLVACGGESENNDDNVNTNSEVSVTDDKKADENTFDTSWASNEFEALLPQLPFTGWETEMNGNTYKMELGGLKTETLTDSEGKTIGYGEDKAALISYLDSLSSYGFTVEETGGIEGYVYEWSVKDANGNEIEITCAEGYCWIEIVKK
ncbi:MAG: hypothetical protein IJN77_04080 [Oscillospiraceae bacterium]|nr:hypothetical protein [Oscillospiraceae bacterium]